jgi:aspartokinase-like uncharacterized kinase
VWRGDLVPDDYSYPTPDGRPATRQCAGERLARVVCGDREMLDEDAVTAIANALAQVQEMRIAEAIARVAARHPSLRLAVVTGLGAFLAARAAQRAGLQVAHLADTMGDAAARCAPAASVALLFERSVGTSTAYVEATQGAQPLPARRSLGEGGCVVETVVKVGGGLLSAPRDFDVVLDAIHDAARVKRLLIVPGGGPFADVVRDVDRRMHLSDDAAHWMAILAMDQYAHLIASRLPHGIVVERADAIGPALEAGRVPVIAPSSWLREDDPLPHTWDVTSDSIAAWVAGQLGAERLVLVKPPGACGDDLVDAHFTRTLGADLMPVIVAADRLESLRDALSARVASA